MSDDDAAHRLSIGGRALDNDVRAHSPQHIDDRRPRRIQSDVADSHFGGRKRRRSHHPERRGRDITRDVQIGGMRVLSSVNRDGQPGAVHIDAEQLQPLLGVVARLHRFGDAGFAVRMESGQEHRALDLCAWHIGLKRDRTEGRSALDGQRRPPVVRRNAGTHPLERDDDAAHRTAAQ